MNDKIHIFQIGKCAIVGGEIPCANPCVRTRISYPCIFKKIYDLLCKFNKMFCHLCNLLLTNVSVGLFNDTVNVVGPTEVSILTDNIH